MNRAIMNAFGTGYMDAVDEGKCPLCSNKVDETTFTDELSRREYKISGICQECQDDLFPKAKHGV